jgi:quinoprotein glucose dehydrogenase
MTYKFFLTSFCFLTTGSAFTQTLDLIPDVRQAEPIIAPASNEAELALQIIQAPDDLDVKLWAAEPMLVNPVAIDVDEMGRVFVSETNRYLTSTLDIRSYMGMLELDLASRTIEDRMALIDSVFEEEASDFKIETEIVRILEDTNGDGKADFSAPFAGGFNESLSGIASGVLARNGKVWFAEIPGLWLLEEGDTPGKAAKRTELARGFGVHFGYTGHDMHGLIFGPDGKLYFSMGDRGTHITTKEGKVLDFPDEGAVFRCDPDGSNLEMFAHGLRNPQELAFDEFGNLFTFDNDCDNGDVERLVYLAEGSDAGWRIGYQYSPLGRAGPWMLENMWKPRHAGQPEYIIPPLANIEDGPSGVAYYPGTGLHSRYQGHFFVCQFRGSIASSGVYTYTLKPNGASFELDKKDIFLKGVLPTDVTFAPNGKLFISDWTPGWPKSMKGRIYTVGHDDTLNTSLVKETESLIREGMSGRNQDQLIELLGHQDSRVRLEAQYELAARKTDPDLLYQVARAGDTNQLSRIHATWALGQMADTNKKAAAAILKLARLASTEVKAQALKLIGDHHLAAGYDTLIASLDDSSDRIKYFSAQSLGKLGNPEAAQSLIDLLLINNDRDVYLRHAAIMGLVGTADERVLAKASKSPYRSVRLGALLVYRSLKNPTVATFLNDSDSTLVEEAARAIIGANIADALPALAALSKKAPELDYMLGLRVLNAHFRNGTAGDAKALAGIAANNAVSNELRIEALHHLSNWATPPARDRVIGLYRPLPDRDEKPAANALSSIFSSLLNAPESVQASAIETATGMNLKSLTKDLFGKFKDNTTPTKVRIAILNTLSKMDDPQVEEAVRIASESDDTQLRLATLPVLAKLSPDSSASMLKHLVETGEAIEMQAAFKALGTMKHPIANQTLTASIQLLKERKIPVPAQLELLEAADAVTHPSVKAALETYKQGLAKSNDPLAPYEYTLEGGDPNEGRNVFEKNSITPCIRCHVSDGTYTGEPGPSLYGIASKVDSKYLLESIIKPSNRMAEGFEMAIVTTKTNDILVGFVSSETEESLSLKLTDGTSRSLAKSEIATRQTAPSTMPEIFANALSRSDLRNLIAYLKTLVEEPLKLHQDIEEYR